MHSSETSFTDGNMGRRGRRRTLPVVLLLGALLACVWLSASALGRTPAPEQPTMIEPTRTVAVPTQAPAVSKLVDDPIDPTPEPHELPTRLPASPTSPPAGGDAPGPAPASPTATPETPTATPETPTATPETPTPTPVTPTPTPVCGGSVDDSYESDDTYAQAHAISTDGVPQCHVNTDPVSDEDWVKFEAVGGHDFEIGTRLLNDINQSDARANDTLLYLYDTDGTTQLAFNDDVGYTTWYRGYYYYRESRINWTAPSDGWYYVRELQWGPTAGYSIRDFHWYELWVLDLDAPPPAAAAELPATLEAMLPPVETATPEPDGPTAEPTGEAPTEEPTGTSEPPAATPEA